MRVPVPMIKPYVEYYGSASPGPADVYSEVWVSRFSNTDNFVNVKEGRIKVHYRPKSYDHWHTYYVYYEPQLPPLINYWNRNQSIEMQCFKRECGGDMVTPKAKMYGSVLVVRTETKLSDDDPDYLFDVDDCEGFVVDAMMKK
jgi:hypothetical protein